MMKLEITMEDFWMEEGQGDFDEQFSEYVISEVKRKIWASIKEEIKLAISEVIEVGIKDQLATKIGIEISKIIDDGVIVNDYYGGSGMPLKEFIEKKINDRNSHGGIVDKMKSIAQDHADELKMRYDLTYASHLVAKLSENGLLKEDAAKLLLEENKD